MFNLSKRQANIVIDLWAKLDGNTDTKNYNKKKLQCDNQKIADQLQHICFLSGKGSKIINRVIGENKKPTIYLIPYNRTNKDANKKEEVQYSGKVWCPTTKDGIVVFRKNGGIFISGNSPFTNLSVYDKYFLEKLCGDYLFPDGSSPDVDVVNKLQEIYLDIINAELERTPLTYPITTACFSVDNENNIQDEKFLDLISEKNKKYGFINIYCGKTSTLSSCCRLRSESDNEYFNSFGSGSSKIGSLGVCSINLPRLAIKSKPDKDAFKQDLLSLVNVCSKINNAKRKVIEKRIKNGNEPLYTYEFMDLSRQYSTVGLNGINECIELMGENILEENGQNFLIDILDAINLENKKLEKQYNAPHNVEQVPGENMSIKLAEKDKLIGYQNRYNIYSNQFIPLTTNADLLDRIFLQGLFDKHFTGGAICHINVESRIDDAEKIKQLIKETAKQGVIYHAINYNLQECEEGHMTVGKKEICSICGTKIINDYSRVVGFLTNTKNWAKVRRDEDYPNRVWYKDI
jgi:ribonucleoside-triphosphate reductase (formate)